MKVCFYRSDSNDLVTINLVVEEELEVITNEMIISGLSQIIDALAGPKEIVAQDANEME